MRPHSDALADALAGSFSTRLIVDSSYGTTRTKTDLGADGWELEWDSEGGEFKSGGTLTVVYTDELARSLTPRQFTDVLAPFGQELTLLLEVSAGVFSETVLLGQFRIVAVPDARDANFRFLGETLTVGSRVTLTLEDRLVGLARWGFRSEETPPVGATCWSELQRISGMQILRSVADVSVPVGTVYQAVQGGRLTAVQELARELGGVPYVTPDGALSVLSDAVGVVVAALVLGEDGTILDVGHSMESDGVYNEVVGTFEDVDRNPIYAVAEVTSGPLATSGPYGRYTRYYSSPLVKTKAGAQSAVDAILARVTSRQVYRVPVQCVLNPLLEDGDVVSVERPTGGTLVGRIVNHKFGAAKSMSLELDVVRTEPIAKTAPVPPWVGLYEDPADPGTYLVADTSVTEDPTDPGTFLVSGTNLTEDPADPGTYRIGA